ncbi:Uu.00g003900.m01.CDS01 [Anthostomella pinea]|uniref:Uu.00g003900.m01.CDS01 n=1 Tax=Anthostomella pinea TaxID=933095 RepID=A0AAI8VJU0_9PEZI|nr:Uu.00g003900.m01.CDS01 [Anthostomella pinea]
MDEQSFYPNGLRSGDDAFYEVNDDDFYGDQIHGIHMSTPNSSAQTLAAAVSAANGGRDAAGPSHLQPSNKSQQLGNEQIGWQGHPASANAFLQGVPLYVNNQVSYQGYNAAGFGQPGNYMPFPDGMPANASFSDPNMSFETLEYNPFSPISTNLSFSSSSDGSPVASEQLAIESMTLGSASAQERNPPVMARSGHHTPVAEGSGQGQAWGGSCPATISPKMLRMNPSPTPTSSTNSVHTGLMLGGESDLGSTAFDQQHHVCNPLGSKRSGHKQRKELPSKSSKPRPPPSSSCGSSSSKGKAPVHAHAHHHHSVQQPVPTHHLVPLKPMPDFGNQDAATLIPVNVADAERAERDRFLVESKDGGMTYKEIRRLGKFTEAESTLRGRYRMLTKNKEERVRKPVWHDNDIYLLKKAVRKLAPDGAKVPWKQVSDYITHHGGSYHFGNSTCRKKYDDLVAQGRAAELA